jgi:hypothetical protein
MEEKMDSETFSKKIVRITLVYNPQYPVEGHQSLLGSYGKLSHFIFSSMVIDIGNT